MNVVEKKPTYITAFPVAIKCLGFVFNQVLLLFMAFYLDNKTFVFISLVWVTVGVLGTFSALGSDIKLYQLANESNLKISYIALCTVLSIFTLIVAFSILAPTLLELKDNSLLLVLVFWGSAISICNIISNVLRGYNNIVKSALVGGIHSNPIAMAISIVFFLLSVNENSALISINNAGIILWVMASAQIIVALLALYFTRRLQIPRSGFHTTLSTFNSNMASTWLLLLTSVVNVLFMNLPILCMGYFGSKYLWGDIDKFIFTFRMVSAVIVFQLMIVFSTCANFRFMVKTNNTDSIKIVVALTIKYTMVSTILLLCGILLIANMVDIPKFSFLLFVILSVGTIIFSVVSWLDQLLVHMDRSWEVIITTVIGIFVGFVLFYIFVAGELFSPTTAACLSWTIALALIKAMQSVIVIRCLD